MTVESHAEEGAHSETRIAQHEAAAHQKRNWVRLTFDCNDHCIFCLDTQAHDGKMRDPQEVKAQILDGRRKGAERLILSGGEPTIHPRFVDFIKLGRLAGYDRIQTVTNGRLFKYPDFLTRCLDEGLQEITFSIHGPNAKVHDALVGVKGAYAEEMEGLRLAMEDGRPIINVDICVNRGNVRHLPAMLEGLYEKGVREFDLLHVIPFGNAWKDGREVLFYNLRDARETLVKAFSWSKRPDVHVWLNRFPVEHLEGFHELIQDPYKLTDEIRGRKEEFARWIDTGETLDCREPRRCSYCYLENVCNTFESTLEKLDPSRLAEDTIEVLRVDTRVEHRQTPIYGGDPASAKKKRLLPMVKRTYLPPTELAREAGVTTLRVVSDSADAALAAAETFGVGKGALQSLELEFVYGAQPDFSHPSETLKTLLSLPSLRRVDTFSAESAAALIAQGGTFEVGVALLASNSEWLLGSTSDRLRVFAPSWERVTQAAELDAPLRPFFDAWQGDSNARGVPACISGTHLAEPPAVDLAMVDPEGRLEPFRFIRRYIDGHYRSKSLRCESCIHDASCHGLNVNHIRAFGFAMLEPVTS